MTKITSKEGLPTLKQYVFAGSIVLFCFLAQFIGHGKVGDDWPNSQIPVFSFWRYGERNIETFLIEVEYWFRAWSEGQGRFLWSGQLHSIAYYWFFQEKLMANLVSASIVFIMLLTWMFFLYLVLNMEKKVFFYFPLSVFLLTRFRWDFDPHIGFTPLLTTMLLYCGLSALFLILSLRSQANLKRFIYAISSAVAAFIALSTYEIAIFVLVSVILIGVVVSLDSSKHEELNSSKRKELITIRTVSFLPLGVAITSYLYIVFAVLRPNANPTGSYSLGFSLIPSTKTFLNHLFATLPLVNADYSKFFLPPQSSFRFSIAILTLVLIFCACICISRAERNFSVIRRSVNVETNTHLESVNSRKKISAISACLVVMLIGPSAMISLQPSYWGRINWGNSYLGIIVQEIALAMILTTWASLAKVSKGALPNKEKRGVKLQRKEPKNRPVLTRKGIYVVSLVVFITSLSNQRFIETTYARDNISATWEAVTENRWLFDEVSDKDVFFSVTHNDAYEINVADIYKRTGLRLAHMLPPSYVLPDYDNCKEQSKCDKLIFNLETLQKVIANSARSFKSSFYSGQNVFRSREQDWPTEMAKQGALRDSKLWFFNIYMVTPSIGIAYLAEMEPNDKLGLTVKLESLKLQQVVLSGGDELFLGISNRCLSREKTIPDVKTSIGLAELSNWRPSNPPTLLDVSTGNPPDYIDPRSIYINVCPPN